MTISSKFSDELDYLLTTCYITKLQSSIQFLNIAVVSVITIFQLYWHHRLQIFKNKRSTLFLKSPEVCHILAFCIMLTCPLSSIVVSDQQAREF